VSSNQLVKELVALLSQRLIEHLSLLETIIEAARTLGAEPPREKVEALREYVESLQAVRSSLASNIDALIKALEEGGVDPESVRDIYALAGYYVEAASRTEDEAASLLAPILGDPGFDDRVRAEFRRLYSLAEKAYRRRDA